MEDFLKYYKFPEEGIKINYMPQFKEYELEKIFSGRPLDYATKKAARIYLRENKGLTNEEAAKSVGTSGKAGGVIVGALKGTWKNRIDETLRKEFKMGSADIKRFKGKHFSDGPTARELKESTRREEMRMRVNVATTVRNREQEEGGDKESRKRSIIDGVTTHADGSGGRVKASGGDIGVGQSEVGFAGGSVVAANDYSNGAENGHSASASNLNGDGAAPLTGGPGIDDNKGFGSMGIGGGL